MRIYSVARRAKKPSAIGGAGALCAALVALACGTGFTAAPAQPSMATTVLVVDDGSPMVAALNDRLTREGVPTAVVDLRDQGRTHISPSYLAASGAGGMHGNFAGVVLPSDAPSGLSADERGDLTAYEAAFGVRQVSMYDWANPTVGLNYAADPGYVGPVDGMSAQVSPAGKAAGFGYLRGTVKLDDLDPAVDESYGYLATPLPATANGGTFTPLVTATIPGTATQGSLMGQYDQGGRERLIITFAANQHQQHFKVLSHGIVTWLTRGISTSLNRNYLSVHSDDLFMSDAKWSIPGKCTIGDGCDTSLYPPTAPGATVRMTAADITRLVRWQAANGVKIDQVFNGFGSQDYAAEHGGVDPLLTTAKADATSIRWINHTLKHEFMGCLQTSNTPPWSCLHDPAGNTLWYPKATVDAEIAGNREFAAINKLPIAAGELVSGEHSGLKTLPQQPVDNPFFIQSLTGQGIRWVASDASREFAPRSAGAATTVPRYPMNLYYNVSTKQESAAEFNWIYTSRVNGGSGLCEDHPDTSTCITPLNLDTGFDAYIKPLEARAVLGRIADNDPRPHFAHQSNLADDGLLYPVLDEAISGEKQMFADNAKLLNPSMSEAGQALTRQQRWTADSTGVTSKLTGNQLKVTNTTGHAVTVPVTVPEGTRLGNAAFGQPYAGQRSDWVELAAGQTLVLTLPHASGFKAPAQWPAPAAPAPGLPRPADVPTTEVVKTPDAVSEVAEAAEAAIG